MNNKWRTFVLDFETTVYEGQTSTEVWLSAAVELFTEDVHIFHSISDTFGYLAHQNGNIVAYYHNLKFDGQFWLSYFMNDLHLKQAYVVDSKEPYIVHWLDDKDMPTNSFKYSISDMGQWYTFTIKLASHIIQLRDSLKLLPFSLARIGKSFQTKHQKLEMEYEGYRYAGCEITDEEKEYISNDVLVLKEALEIMYNDGHNRLTIGSCCLYEFKNSYDKMTYNLMYPDLTTYPLDVDEYGSPTVDAYIRQSYKGGWCYVVPEKSCKLFHKGITADVNSLYPSMMHSESGNYYPVGEPTFWKGNYIPEKCNSEHYYYFVRIKTRFKIKSNCLPTIQIKNNPLYPAREWLTTSDIYDKYTDKYYSYYQKDNTLYPTQVLLTLTQTDFILLKEHYDLYDFEILDGCYFSAEKGIFDRYINKYREIKVTSKGAKRELAKLYLNNLYGKMASSTRSDFKLAYLQDEVVHFLTIPANEKRAGYIPIGSAITSYARNFTIRTAQKNYHGTDKPGFIYADTDSIHCDLDSTQLIDVPVHSTAFCHWKLEATWDKGWFVRPKTYIEHVIEEDLHPIENPFYNIKCAGLPQKCKELLLMSMEGYTDEQYNSLNPEEQSFVSTKRTITDFNIGLTIPSKLLPRTIKGGVILTPTTYEMR